MMKKLLKIIGFSVLGFIVLMIVIGILLPSEDVAKLKQENEKMKAE